MGDTSTNSLPPDSTEAKDLPPPRISQEKIDRLLKTLSADPILNSNSPSTTEHKLNGREVLVPAFGGIAFYEGELCPETRSKSGSSSNNEEEEIVYIHTTETTNKLAGKQQQPNQLDEKDVAEVGFLEAIEWLRKYSTNLTPNQKISERTNNTATKAAANKSSSHGGSKRPPSKPSPRSHASDEYQVPAGPMFNINEEYSADGTRIVGEAVNLSSRLKAVYGDDNPENFNRPQNEDSKMEEEDTSFDPSITEEEEKTAKPAVTDEEYDKISKRLEELAMMEEEEAKREKEGRRKPAKPLGGTKSPTQAKSSKPKAKSSSSFGFQKGFLNKKTSAKPKAPKRDSKSSQSGVTIDVSQNKIHEIPREGRQQPVPSRKPPKQEYVEQVPSGSRLLDTSVFSGQISERTMPSARGVISRDVAARVAANEQTQTLQNEIQQRQQQQQARPKRISRFRQQRQEEQHQQQR